MMDQENKQVEETVDLPVQGSGSILAASRKRQNKTIEEIADELNLSVSQIKAIELDQTEGLPEPTYVRGYIRSYAKLLGLKPEEVLQNYLNQDWKKSTNLDEMPRGIGSAEESTSSGFFTPVKLLLLIILAVVISYLWFSGFFAGSVDPQVTENTVEQSVVEESNADFLESVDVSTTDGQVEEESGLTTEETAVKNELVLNFSQTSWVDIRDESDNRLAYRSYTAGEELIVSSEGSMSVFVGNAEGVEVKYNGQPFDIAKHREGVYAKFITGEEQ